MSVSADALSGTKENGHLSIYVPYTEGHGLRTAYRLSADWWWALLDIPTWQSPVTIIKDRVMEEETFLEDGGLYQRNYDGTCRLLQVLSTDDGTFIVRKDTTEIAKDALAFCEDLSVLVLPEALTELPEGSSLAQQRTGSAFRSGGTAAAVSVSLPVRGRREQRFLRALGIGG